MKSGKRRRLRLWLGLCVAVASGLILYAAVVSAAEPAGGAAGGESVELGATQAPAAEAGNRGGAGQVGAKEGVEVAGARIKLTGYVREYFSMNLQNPPETKQNDRWDISMARTSIWLDMDTTVGDVRFHAVGRSSGEIKTDYLKRLEALGAAGGDLMQEYNKSELREAFLEFPLGNRTLLRLGKQQVVWGESDFFKAMDVVHGFDFTWRSFLEAETEEYRKGLILGNAIIQVPEAKGSLQLLFRPGLDRNADIGNTYDLFGGRWANQPNKGVDFLAVLPYNFKNPDADTQDPTWGVRWAGILGPVNYSLAYLRTFGPDPVVNSAFVPFKSPPVGLLGDLIFPKVDMFGATVSGYSALADAVFSVEATYTLNQFYNVGANFLGGALPGFGGIIEKDTVRSMVRMDKVMRGWLEKALFASRPPFFSIQVFDTWIPDFKKSDDIVFLVGYGAPQKEHSTIATVILAWNYMNDRINPSLAAGYDVSYGGGFIIPGVDFAFGDKWRLKMEADLFLPKHSKSPGEIEQQTTVFGYFKNNDQLFLRLTRQF